MINKQDKYDSNSKTHSSINNSNTTLLYYYCHTPRGFSFCRPVIWSYHPARVPLSYKHGQWAKIV